MSNSTVKKAVLLSLVSFGLIFNFSSHNTKEAGTHLLAAGDTTNTTTTSDPVWPTG